MKRTAGGDAPEGIAPAAAWNGRGRAPEGDARAAAPKRAAPVDQVTSVVLTFQPNLTPPPMPPLSSWALYSKSIEP